MPKTTELVLISRDELETLRKGMTAEKLLQSLEVARKEGYEAGYKAGIQAGRVGSYEEGYAKGLACGEERGKNGVIHKVREDGYKAGMEQGRIDILESFQSELDILSQMKADIEGKTYKEGFQHGVARGMVGLQRIRLKHLQLQQLADREGHCEREKRRYYKNREEITQKIRARQTSKKTGTAGAGAAGEDIAEASSENEE